MPESTLRTSSFIATLLVAASCLCSPASTAQETRPLTVWVDPVRLNVCGPRTFQTPIRVASFGTSDTVIGFRTSDNVASATLYVTWDPSTLDLDDIALVGGTMAQTVKTVVRKFPQESTLEIIIADDRPPYGLLDGQQPLLYLSGTVKAPDTVAGLDGWIKVTDVELTSDTRFTPEQTIPGFVAVVRDTTPAYTGTLTLQGGTFDTLRFDTVVVALRNVSQRRVREVEFVLTADTEFFGFVDTLSAGMLGSRTGWTLVETELTADTLRVRYVAASDLSQEGPLLGIVLSRRTDSAFQSEVRVVSATVNDNSCLGRFRGVGTPVTASAIVADTTTTLVPAERTLGEAVEFVAASSMDGWVMARTGGRVIDEVRVVDGLGRPVGYSISRSGSGGGLRIQLDSENVNGSYIVQLRSGREQVSKQFIFIK